MVQSGLVDKWRKNEVDTFKQSVFQGKGGGQGEGSKVAVKPLTLDHLQGAIYILGSGALLAANVLFIEGVAQYLTSSHLSTWST
ncbi:hypothetical protein Pcinc_000243 [Petrolisthes cinctipes]|uniref:Uncharacterized protein n=1 Tax=Petrolisthes cinctipes TaxID=88211 RepID=A0AAE1GQ18_PETCI|nr:hypothetical protein Pcinc_000243 [Petrolisthes cinctipes]